MKRKNLILVFMCIVIISISFIVGSRFGDFEGTDDGVQDKIMEINRNYKPWFENIWSPSSGEVETMFFMLQAAAGGAYIVYYIGRKRNVQNNNGICKEK